MSDCWSPLCEGVVVNDWAVRSANGPGHCPACGLAYSEPVIGVWTRIDGLVDVKLWDQRYAVRCDGVSLDGDHFVTERPMAHRWPRSVLREIVRVTA